MPNQEHVCIAITKSNMGGAQKYVLTLATELKKAGKRVTVIAGGEGELFRGLEQAGIECVRLKSSQRDVSITKELKFARELYRALRDLRPDVLHLNSSKMGGMGAFIGNLAGIKKIVFTAHGWAFNENRPNWQKWVFYLLYWITISACDMTICVSKKTREQILFLPLIKNKTTVVYNGVTSPDFYTRDEARQKLSAQFPFLDLNKKWIAVLAELHPIKGHDILIEAVSDIRNTLADYQVVCLGSGEAEDKLKRMVVEKNVGTYVYFTGFIQNASRYLSAFEISVLPSRSEAMPLAVIESGLAGNLVVASAVGGIPEIIDDGKSGFLFERESVPELSSALRNAAALNDISRNELTGSLKAKVEAEFSTGKMVDETLRVYGNITS